MQLSKFTHSCIRLDDGDRALVIDPGLFSEVDAALDGACGVLITHEHPDHIDADKLRAAAKRDPRLRIWAPSSVSRNLTDLGDQVVTTSVGDEFDAGGFAIRAYGGQHALIHQSIPVVINIGYLIEGTLFHPGDSLEVPPVAIETLLVPLHAPWSRTGEVIDFAVSVRAPKAYPIHDALLTAAGRGLVEGHLGRIAGEHGSEYQPLAPGSVVTV
jgi:L-ascorbate metabolism protein UlaG (beta-lactamase superfamily)